MPLSLEDRLENWALAQRRHMGYDTAKSFEGHYRSPQCWDDPIWHIGPGVDRDDAREVELGVCSLDLFNHVLLKAHYVRKWEPRRCLRAARSAGSVAGAYRSGEAVAALDDALRVARSLLGESMSRPAVVRRARAVYRARVALEMTGPEWDLIPTY